MQTNQVAHQYGEKAASRPKFFLKNPSMLGSSAPLRVGTDLRMGLTDDEDLIKTGVKF